MKSHKKTVSFAENSANIVEIDSLMQEQKDIDFSKNNKIQFSNNQICENARPNSNLFDSNFRNRKLNQERKESRPKKSILKNKDQIFDIKINSSLNSNNDSKIEKKKLCLKKKNKSRFTFKHQNSNVIRHKSDKVAMKIFKEKDEAEEFSDKLKEFGFINRINLTTTKKSPMVQKSLEKFTQNLHFKEDTNKKDIALQNYNPSVDKSIRVLSKSFVSDEDKSDANWDNFSENDSIRNNKLAVKNINKKTDDNDTNIQKQRYIYLNYLNWRFSILLLPLFV